MNGQTREDCEIKTCLRGKADGCLGSQAVASVAAEQTETAARGAAKWDYLSEIMIRNIQKPIRNSGNCGPGLRQWPIDRKPFSVIFRTIPKWCRGNLQREISSTLADLSIAFQAMHKHCY